MTCLDCRIETDEYGKPGDNRPAIHLCPLHEKAGEMLELLRGVHLHGSWDYAMRIAALLDAFGEQP